ncbi:unnamed protein product [Rotaria sp. Silwood1]|nr:unnamed protein product [Rotaria sp. Silwood1]
MHIPSCLFILESHEDDLNKSLIIILKQKMLSLLFKDDILDINDNLKQQIIFIDHLMDKTVLEFATSTQQLQSQTRVYVVFRALISAHYSTKVNQWVIL